MVRSSSKKILVTACILGFLSVALGAFAAHGLKARISPSALSNFNTAVLYQMFHALVLLFVGGTPLLHYRDKQLIYWVFLIGLVFFSGSIYLLATKTLTAIDTSAFSWVTPLGGVFLSFGWLLTGYHFVQNKNV